MVRSPRRKRWCFTLNNPDNLENTFFLLIANSEERRKQLSVRYIVFQTEKAPTTGTIHLQGYIEFIRQVSLKNLKEHISDNASWRVCSRGTGQQNKTYCTKADTRHPGPSGEGGLMAGTKADSLVCLFKNKADNPKITMAELEEEHPATVCKYYTKITKSFLRTLPKRTKCIVKLLYGKTGCGKSYYARHCYEDKSYYSVPTPKFHNGRWDWPGYEGQEYLIMDEFDSSWMRVIKFKKFIDEYEFSVEVKGEDLQMKTNYIVMTTNKDPVTWYKKYMSTCNKIMRDALERRFHDYIDIYDCTKNPDYTEDGQEPYMTMEKRIKKDFKFDAPYREPGNSGWDMANI